MFKTDVQTTGCSLIRGFAPQTGAGVCSESKGHISGAFSYDAHTSLKKLLLIGGTSDSVSQGVLRWYMMSNICSQHLLMIDYFIS